MLVLLNGTCEILFIFAIEASYFKIFIIIYIHHILLRLIKLILDWSLWILYASVSLLEMQDISSLKFIKKAHEKENDKHIKEILKKVMEALNK